MDDEQMDGWMNKRMDHEWIDGQQKKKSKKERKGRKEFLCLFREIAESTARVKKKI